MPISTGPGYKVVRTVQKYVTVQLEMFPDPNYLLKNPVSGPDVVLRSYVDFDGKQYTAQVIVHKEYLSGKAFDIGAEGAIAHAIVEHLIPKLIAELKDEYIEAVQNGTFRPIV